MLLINNFKSSPKKILTHKISFPFVLICFILFSFAYSLPNLILQNTLPAKYFQKVKSEEIEENADLYLLSTKDGYLRALNDKKQEIWKAYLDDKLMSCSELNPKQISKNEYLFPFNEQLYIIKDYREFQPFDAYIKDLVKKHYVAFNDLTLIGKIKTTIFIIDSENGEIIQKIDEDSNFISNKKIYLRQKSRRKKTLTVVRVDYILNCIQIKDEEKFWNASYSDILIKKGNEFDNLDDNNFFIDTNFVKKFINSYKLNNMENSEINFNELVTAYAYFDKEDIPNIKIYDKSLSSKNLNLLEKKEMSESLRYGYYLIDENEGKIKVRYSISMYIKENFIFIIIIFILCLIIFFILSYYNKKMKIHNAKNEIKIEKKEENKLIEKEENLKEENKDIKHINSDKEEKENTNITEESKDFLEEDKKTKEEITELIHEEKEKEITIYSGDKTKEINNINNEFKNNNEDNNKEKSIVLNGIWDSDEEEDENEEKSKTKTKQKINTISNKSKKSNKTKTNKEDNKEENEDEEEDEEEEESDEEEEKKEKNKDEILIEDSKQKDDEKIENIIFENKKEKENINVKKKMTRLDTDFENLEKIGEGGYGLVLKGTHRIDKYIYAIKIINISDFKNLAEIDEIVNEANKMSMIKDKYIVNYNICWYEDNLGSAEKFYEKKEEDEDSKSKSSSLSKEDKNGRKSNNSTKLMRQESEMNNLRSLYCTSFRDDSKLLNTSILSMKYKKKFFMILMEYCDGNTLEDLIKKHVSDSTPIDRKLIYNFTKQILKGLKVLHRNGIIHSDIKPGNIFLKKVGEIEQIKIGDFGMATVKKGAKKLKSKDIKGYTPLYSAPEQKNKKGTYNEKIDIYACGLILYELIGCFGTNAEKYRAFDDLKENGKILDYIENKYKEECELIKIMTKKDYDERPSAEEILGNDIFKELGKNVNK